MMSNGVGLRILFLAVLEFKSPPLQHAFSLSDFQCILYYDRTQGMVYGSHRSRRSEEVLRMRRDEPRRRRQVPSLRFIDDVKMSFRRHWRAVNPLRLAIAMRGQFVMV